MAVSNFKVVLICLTTLSFVTLLAFSGIASRGSSKSLYPQDTGKVSEKYTTQITPSASTFSIWGFIYFYQCLWLLYILSIICRKRAADILPAEFFILFVLSSICTTAWLVVWSRELLIVAFILLAAGGLALIGCVYYALCSIHYYVTYTPDQDISTVDVWCHRLLIINGVMFYSTWVSFATLLNLTIVLQYSMRLSPLSAAVISLTALCCTIIVWFIFENFMVEKFSRYCFSEYIVLLAGLGGVMSRTWVNGEGTQGYVLFIFTLVGIMMAFRFVVMFLRERDRTKSQTYFKIVV